jgi:hypothetical protein
MADAPEPPSELASAAALVNNYANGIALDGFSGRNCITMLSRIQTYVA